MRKIRPRTVEGYLRWLSRCPTSCSNKYRRWINQYKEVYDIMILYAHVWNHHELGFALPSLGKFTVCPETLDSQLLREKSVRRYTAQHLPTTDLRRITLYKTNPLSRAKRPMKMPWPWP